MKPRTGSDDFADEWAIPRRGSSKRGVHIPGCSLPLAEAPATIMTPAAADDHRFRGGIAGVRDCGPWRRVRQAPLLDTSVL
jgi:hypothetical protein